MKRARWLIIFSGFLVWVPNASPAAEALQLVDGDRVVFLGNTLIEREQRYGYWETMLTARFNTSHIIFRNLGWSGDTVFGDARAGFGSAAEGFQHLKEQVFSVKPTVIFIAYGGNESFEGKNGLPHFLQGLDGLLDVLAPTKARMVLLSPLPLEDLGPPLPVPTEQNAHVRLYRDAIRAVAKKRSLRFVDLCGLLGDGHRETQEVPLTDNGIHLTAYGYWRTAALLEKGLGLEPVSWNLEVGVDPKRTHLSLKTPAASLPAPPPPEGSPMGAALAGYESKIRIRGLAAGKYVVKVDGGALPGAMASDWAKGKAFERGPELKQVEQLRRVIIEKNRQYFHRWRPQNETYLFGFRKHEQGQNSKEIPQFDPLVANLEAVIDRLKVPAPVAHQYELIRQPEAER